MFPLRLRSSALPMTTTRDPQDDDTSESDDSVPDVIAPDSLSANPGPSSAEKPENPTQRHSDKPVAVVTGAARRVGREIALAMAARGLAVVVHHGTSTVEANVLVNRIRNEGGTAVAVSADLRDPRAAAMTVFEAAAELGEVTTLINSTAVFQNRALPWIDLYHCNVHLSVNLLAPIFLAQQFIRQLGEGQHGHIINILDWRAQRPGADHVVYTATKAAWPSVTKSPHSSSPLIQVNGLATGAMLACRKIERTGTSSVQLHPFRSNAPVLRQRLWRRSTSCWTPASSPVKS